MADARYRLRVSALIGAGALGVHELRYLIAYGDQSSHELALQGHGYLPGATALVVAALALAGVELLALVGRARTGGAYDARRPSLSRVWLGAAAALMLVYAGQELVEGLLASGHPEGVSAVLGDGGWVAVPLALGFGLVVALALRGAELAVSAAARRARSRRTARGIVPRCRPRPLLLLRTSSPLAAKLAGRAPPARC